MSLLIKQLSIFLENKKGRLSEVAVLLGDEGINMTAFTVTESSDFGLLRLIVSDSEKALAILKEKGFAVSMTEVICLQCPNEPGALGKAMTLLTAGGVFIEYMYVFSQNDRANVIIRPHNMERCTKVLLDNKLVLLAENDLYKIG